MTMTPHLRKIALIAHVTSSIGWFGAVVAFLAIACVGLMSTDAQLARAAYLGLSVTTWAAVIPLALISLLTGIISSLGTNWGLLRYYWVAVKLWITVVATAILLVHTQPIAYLAGIAESEATFSHAHNQQLLMVVASGATLVILIVLISLSVYKPRGLTRYGWKKQYGAADSAKVIL